MEPVHVASPDPGAILRAWQPFKQAIGVTSVQSEADYARAQATMAILLDEVGDDEQHPLADVLDWLADQVAGWEAEHCRIPAAEPKEVLRFLLEQHDLKQSDLADCAPQGRISDILAGRRGISKEVARKLAQRFNVSAALFL